MTVAINVPLGHHDAHTVLALLRTLNKQAEDRARHDARRRQEPWTELPPVQCKPWCEYGNGHPGQHGTSDQACWSEAEYVDFSLEPMLHDSGNVFPQRFGVMTRQEPGSDGVVYLHLDAIRVRVPIVDVDDTLDESLHLTPAEARALGNALIREAARLEGTG